MGSTGMMGQRFIQLLHRHPFFELDLLFSSERREGRRYEDDVTWLLEGDIPSEVSKMDLNGFDIDLLEDHGIDVLFSALPSSIPRDMEKEASKAGFPVFSNSATHRMDCDVPIMVPEVNGDHLELITSQDSFPNGFIVTNPNCSTSGLVMSLKPLIGSGISRVFVSTYQSVSGAGYPGPSSYSMISNVIPFIEHEEEKVRIETGKILGDLSKGSIMYHSVKVYPSCVRIPVKNGHLLSVQVEMENDISEVEAMDRFRSFKGLEGLPSSPDHPIILMEGNDRPQPALDAIRGDPVQGMSVSVGRIRKSGNVLSFFALVNNTIRGGAGNAILSAELAKIQDHLGGGYG